MDTSNCTLPPLYDTIKTLTNDESNRLNAMFPRKQGGPCGTCQDTKTFRWYRFGSRQPEDVVTYDCPCIDQFLLSRRLLASGVYESYQRMGWADFEDQSSEAIAVAQNYLKNAVRYFSAGVGMIFYGDMGNGKSLLANLMIKDLIQQGYTCYSNTFQDMIDTFIGGWRDRNDKEWYSQKVINADILLIDDLGRERIKGAGTVGEEALERVVRHRVARSRPTLITANSSPDQMAGGYGGNVVSLLRECSTGYQFTDSDWRDKKNSRTDHEIIHGLTRPVTIS